MIVMGITFEKCDDFWFKFANDGSCTMLANNGLPDSPRWEATEHKADGTILRQSRGHHHSSPFMALRDMLKCKGHCHADVDEGISVG